MRLVFTLEEEVIGDPTRMLQFEICLLSARITTPTIPIVVQVPADYFWPTTWQTLTDKGYTFMRGVETFSEGDINTKGQWCSVANLYKCPNPPVEANLLPVPERQTTLQQAIIWLEQNRTNNHQHWLPIDPTMPLFWATPPLNTLQPMQHWLQWSQWRKQQPVINPDHRNFTSFQVKRRIRPPQPGL